MAPSAASTPPDRDVWENSPDAQFIVDVEPQGRFRLRAFSPASERLTGLAADKVVGLEIGEFLPPDGVGHTRGHLQLCAREKRPVTYLEALGFPSGSRHWRTTVSPVLGPDGEVERILGRAELIRTPEPEDLMAEVELQAVLDGLPNGIALLDRHGTVVFGNATWREFGKRHKVPAHIGLNYLDVCAEGGAGLPPRGEVEGLLRQLLAGELQRFELRYRWRDRRLLLRARGLAAGGLPRAALSHADITRVVAAEEVLARTAEQLLAVQQEESARVARELHDSTAQHLVAVNLGLARLRKTGAPQDVLDDMREALSEAHREIRTLTYLLYPPQLSDQGLEATLRTFVYGYRKRTGLDVEITMGGALETLPDSVQRAVFRVVLEALASVHERSRATRATVDILLEQGDLRVTVCDDGSAVDPAAGAGIRGLRGMQARFTQFDGKLTVGRGERGTTVEGVIPASGLRRAAEPAA